MGTVASRLVRPATAGAVLAGAALLVTALLVTGCGSASTPATVTGVGSASVAASPGRSPSVSTGASAAQTAADTFLAQGQDINATPLRAPACDPGCLLSGDATAILSAMTWTTWSATEAVGTGTYELDDCNPSCASGTVYPVAAVVTLSQPVKACSPAGPRWFWSRASFRFPDGLPKELRGPDAPENPWPFSSLATAARQSCGWPRLGPKVPSGQAEGP